MTKLKHSEQQEAIAIVGLSCRFPQANDSAAFWELLARGGDAVTEVPKSRFDIDEYYDEDPEKLGKISTRYGGFLDQVDQFDPAFFGIPPRAAKSMDPQQRLILEVTWEALEHANIPPASLKNTQSGVFIGVSEIDYAEQAFSDLSKVDIYAGTGNGQAFVSGRLAYILGLKGPAKSIDTACSSSLVAIHDACHSLRSGETELAIVGGTHLILNANNYIFLTRSKALSPDGHCKTFDAKANGFARGEGCGVVVLKRLSDAQQAGDNVLAVIRGSAVNNDGPSGGLTMPNPAAQTELIQSALKNSGLKPHQMGYLEAHGTGTLLGDPIELHAAGKVFADDPQRADDQPLYVGSVKSNIGHSEPAAGIAGLIKVVLAMQANCLPKQANYEEANPKISWEKLPFQVLSENTAWPIETQIAGVSSFGLSGTNAHVILEGWDDSSNQVEQQARAAVCSDPEQLPFLEQRPFNVLTLSAKSPAALSEQAQQYAQFLTGETDSTFADICYSAAVGRQHFPYRLSVVAHDNIDAQQKLSLLGNDSNDAVYQHKALRQSPDVAFLFTGQGAQFPKMGYELYQSEVAFRESMQRCDQLLEPLLGLSLLNVLYSDDLQDNDSHPVHQTQYTQPALFAVEYALAKLWISWGVTPKALIGHSLGELVAACIAGVFSIEDAIKLVANRARLMGALPDGGGMLSVMVDESRAQQLIAPHSGQLDIAVINSHNAVVISGAQEALDAVSIVLGEEGIKSRSLNVSHAFHSSLMEPMLDEFLAIAEGITYHSPKYDIVSNVSGALAGDEICTPAYWVQHIRNAVRFADGIDTLRQMKISVFLEIGPQPTLLGMAAQSEPEQSKRHLFASLRKGQSNSQTLLKSLGDLHQLGVTIDWQSLDPLGQRKKVNLPYYPFQRQRHWVEASRRSNTKRLLPLIDSMTALPAHQEVVFETEFSTAALPFLNDHQVYGETVSPGACQLAMVINGVKLAFKQTNVVELQDVILPQALVIPEGQQRKVQASFSHLKQQDSPAGQYDFSVISIDSESVTNLLDQSTVATHAKGQIAVSNLPNDAEITLDIAQLQQQHQSAINLDALYRHNSALAIELGESFRWFADIWMSDTTKSQSFLASLRLPRDLDLSDYSLHPGLLDACFQISAAADLSLDQVVTRLPFSLVSLAVHTEATGRQWWCYAKRNKQGAWDMQLADEQGRLIADIDGFVLREAPATAVQSKDRWQDWLYQIEWQATPSFALRPNFIRAPAELAVNLQQAGPKLWLEHEGEDYQHFLDQLNVLSVEYIVQAFTNAGVVFTRGEYLSSEQVIQQFDAIPEFNRLLQRLLAILCDANVLKASDDGWQVLQSTSDYQPHHKQAELAAHHADKPAYILLNRCAEKLCEVLRGSQDPLELLFPAGDTSVATELYTRAPEALVMNGLVQQMVKEVVRDLPSNAGLQVIEVGGGTGGTTAGLLSLLPENQSRYTFTDIGSLFIRNAQQRFTDYDFVNYKHLNIEDSPASQGFAFQQADLLLAVNVLHATLDIGETLRHVRQLLKPGGQLMLVEVTERSAWLDLTFGLTADGWWRFADQREDHPLMTPQEWETLLLAQGFDTVEVTTQGEQSLIVARAGHEAVAVEKQPDVSVLLFADEAGTAEALALKLQQQGKQSVLVYDRSQRSAVEQVKDDNLDVQYIDIHNPDDYLQLLKTYPKTEGVMHLRSLDLQGVSADTDVLQSMRESCGTALALCQSVLQLSDSQINGVWLVTQNAQNIGEVVGNDTDMAAVMQSGLWGLGQAIAIEHPELNCIRIDIKQDVEKQILIEQLAHETSQSSEHKSLENQLALHSGKRYVARLNRFETAQTEDSLPTTCDANGTYLITGGLGGLGLAIAEYLVEQGARHLMLLGRSEPSSEAQQAVTKLRDTGVTVTTLPVDVSELASLKRSIEQIPSEHPLKGAIHSVGVLDDALLMQQNWQRFETVLKPKVLGAWNLHLLTQELPLDFFVLFSSVASFLGSVGQSNHASANSFLDAFAGFRRAQGLPALTINWSGWSDIGAFADIAKQQRQQLMNSGMDVITPEQGITAFDALLSTHTQGQVGVMPILWPRYLRAGHGHPLAQTPFYKNFQHLAERAQETQDSSQTTVSEICFSDRLASLSGDDRTSLMQEKIRERVAVIMAVPDPQQIDLQRSLLKQGMDSLMSIELTNDLSRILAVTLGSTLVFNHPSIEQLSEHLLSDILSIEQNGSMDLTVVPRTAEMQLSFAQQRFWAHQATDPQGCFHNVAWLLRITGTLDVAILQQSLDVLIERHEILRTTFPMSGDQVVAVVCDSNGLAMTQVDLSGIPNTEQKAEIYTLLQLEVQERSFDLATGPLTRATLVKLNENEHLLLLCQHHIITNIPSLLILTQEWYALYDVMSHGQTPSLDKPELQYLDYAAWQRRTLTEKALKARQDYWHQWLGEAKPILLELPTDRPRKHPSYQADSLKYQYSASTTRAIRQLNQSCESSQYAFVMTALAILLNRYSQSDDIVIGSPFSTNWDNGDSDAMVGFLGGLLQLRIDLSEQPSFRTLLSQVSESVQSAMAYQDIPLQQVEKLLQSEKPTQAAPFFRVMLNYFPEGAPGDAIEALNQSFPNADIQLSLEQPEQIENRPDLTLWMYEDKQQAEPVLKGIWRYRTDLFDKETVIAISDDFHELLEALCAQPDQSVNKLAFQPSLNTTTLQEVKHS